MGIILIPLFILIGFSLILLLHDKTSPLPPTVIESSDVQITLVIIAAALSMLALFAPTTKSLEILWSITPTILVAIAFLFIRIGFNDFSKKSWLQFGISLGIVATINWILFDIARQDSLGGLIVIFIAAPAVFIGIGAAIGLAIFLPKWSKLAAIFFGILIPISFYASTMIGSNDSPDSVTRQNGAQIAAAIEQYKLDKGSYPETLDQLIPEYFDELPEIQVYGRKNWLYKTNGEQYSFGYEDTNDKDICGICTYSTAASEWNCDNISRRDLKDWDVFSPVCQPTPSPEPYIGTLEGLP